MISTVDARYATGRMRPWSSYLRHRHSSCNVDLLPALSLGQHSGLHRRMSAQMASERALPADLVQHGAAASRPDPH